MEKVPADRHAAVEVDPEEFRAIGHEVVNELADFLATLPQRPVARDEAPAQVRAALGTGPLPEAGSPPEALLRESIRLLAEHSLFNGHPRFWGYITASPTPIGALGDLIAATMNPNVGGWGLAPMASEIEAQTVRWIAQLIGFPDGCGGVLSSGGNVANFVAFLTARRAKAPWDVRQTGLRAGDGQLTAYVSAGTHTWIEKAADLFGLGGQAVRWIATDADRRMRLDALEDAITRDRQGGFIPFLVVGAAGTVGTGAVDPLPAIAELCRREDLWFHVDGAYGAFAAALPEACEDLKGLRDADSIALDPHKWLYSPLEAGCTLVRQPRHMIEAFSFHPSYFHFPEGDDPGVNFYEFGLQNSRGFRALKVWLGLRHAGRAGVIEMIRDDIALSRAMHEAAAAHPELRAATQDLSISTFRYVPGDLQEGDAETETYLNALNEELLTRLQVGGEAYVSNAVIDDTFLLRACIVNFRTRLADVQALPELVVRLGAAVDREMRPAPLS